MGLFSAFVSYEKALEKPYPMECFIYNDGECRPCWSTSVLTNYYAAYTFTSFCDTPFYPASILILQLKLFIHQQVPCLNEDLSFLKLLPLKLKLKVRMFHAP